jgi:hypothetical protein
MGINEERTILLRCALDYHKHNMMDIRAQETHVSLHDIKVTIW